MNYLKKSCWQRSEWYLTLMLLVANFTLQDDAKNLKKMTETLANGYSFESAQRELSNEYQYDRVYMVFKSFCVLVLWTKQASTLTKIDTGPVGPVTPSIYWSCKMFTGPRCCL